MQTDRQDKCALGWDHQEKLQLHDSQKDYAKGFGGKYGVQKDRMDKVSAAHLPPVGPGRAEPSVSVRCPAGGLGWRGPLSQGRVLLPVAVRRLARVPGALRCVTGPPPRTPAAVPRGRRRPGPTLALPR